MMIRLFTGVQRQGNAAQLPIRPGNAGKCVLELPLFLSGCDAGAGSRAPCKPDWMWSIVNSGWAFVDLTGKAVCCNDFYGPYGRNNITIIVQI